MKFGKGVQGNVSHAAKVYFRFLEGSLSCVKMVDMLSRKEI